MSRSGIYLFEGLCKEPHYLATLRLTMHAIKSQLFETSHGANFVGVRILPDRIQVRNDNLRHARRRMKELQRQYAAGEIELKPLVQRLQNWEAHLRHGNIYRLRRKVFEQYSFVQSEATEKTRLPSVKFRGAKRRRKEKNNKEQEVKEQRATESWDQSNIRENRYR